jgi:hypothetical protein
MVRLWLIVAIIAAYIAAYLILKYKLKIKRPKYIDVNALRPKYYMYLLAIVLVFSLIISFAMQSGTYVLICLLISKIIDCIYRINYLKNDKSKYYIVTEFIFIAVLIIFFIDSLFWK